MKERLRPIRVREPHQPYGVDERDPDSSTVGGHPSAHHSSKGAAVDVNDCVLSAPIGAIGETEPELETRRCTSEGQSEDISESRVNP